MENQNKYLGDLKEELRVKLNLLLGYDVDNKKFRKGDYEYLADNINAKLRPLKSKEVLAMGKTISWETLRQILKYKFEISEPVNRKINKTLSKISVYLGRKNWQDYITKINDLKTADKALILERIKQDFFEAMEIQRQLYLALPTIDTDLMKQTFISSGMFYRQLMEEFLDFNERGFILQAFIGYGDISNFIIIDHNYYRTTILVKENWRSFVPFEITEYKTRQRISEPYIDLKAISIGDYCIYVLIFQDGKWKILDRMVTVWSIDKHQP